MEEVQDYYALLGVSHNATADDIKRAFHRKRREYQNDEQKTLQLNVAFDFLMEEAERKNHERGNRHEIRIRKLKEIIQNSDDQETVRNSFLELKKIYEEILLLDAANLEALVNLCNIAGVLENQKEEISYLVRIEQCAKSLTDTSEALECRRFLVRKYEKYEKYDEAIRLLKHMCQEDADDIEDVIHLARLFNESRGDLNSALLLLNESINLSKRSRSKMHYLCELLRVVHIKKNGDYVQTDEIYEKMESLISESRNKNDRASANELANKLLIYMNDFLATQNFSVLHHLEKFYLLCSSTDKKDNQLFAAFQQVEKAIQAGKIHKAVSLFLGGKMNKDVMKKIAYYISDDAVGIKVSIEYVKDKLPLYWEIIEEEQRAAFENVVEENLIYSKELYDMRNDTSICMDLKEAFECFIIVSIIDDKEILDKGCGLANDFLKNEGSKNPENLQKILRKLELFYPNSYKNLSIIFFDGKSTEEIFGIQQNSASDSGSSAKENNSGISQSQDVISVRRKRKIRWWMYPGCILAFLFLTEELENGDFLFWAIAIILGICLFANWKKDKQPAEKLQAKEEKKNTARHVILTSINSLQNVVMSHISQFGSLVNHTASKYGKKIFKTLGIGLGIFGVCLIAVSGIKYFLKDSDSLQTVRNIERDRGVNELYPVSNELRQTDNAEGNDTPFLTAFPDGDESKVPVTYVGDFEVSWEETKALAAAQRPVLKEYLGCSEDNLWCCYVECIQKDIPKVSFWYIDDYNRRAELKIILLEDGTAAWLEENVTYIDDGYYEDATGQDTSAMRMEGEFAVYTIEKNAFKDMQNPESSFDTRTLSELSQKAEIADYMGWNVEDLSYYGINDAGRMDFENNSENSSGLTFLLDDGTVAMHNDGEAPYRVIGNHNILSEFSLAEQQDMVEEYLGCSEGHIKYSYSADNIDGDIRPLFLHIEGDSTESGLYLADDFTVRQLADYLEKNSETVDRNHFHPQ